MVALGIGVPSMLRTRPSTNMYSPLPSDAIESPFITGEAVSQSYTRQRLTVMDSQSGASSVKNGPRTLLSVAPVGGLLRASTSAEAPKISERRINSWRVEVHF